MPETSARLALPFVQPSQAQKHVTVNESLQRLDAVAQLVLVARDVADPPAAPVAGQAWGVGAGATGDWAGHDGEIASFDGTGWIWIAPGEGWRAWDLATGELVIRTATGWEPVSAGGGGGALDPQNLAGVGIGTTSDATNRLAVASPATLLTHEGAGHQVKVNKAASGDTASLLFQTAFAGQAEMGLAGTDDFAIKVAGGGAWPVALAADRVTGRVTFPNGVAVTGGTAAGLAMDDALLSDPVLTNATSTGGSFAGATLDDATLTDAALTGGTASGVAITGGSITNAAITGGTIANAALSGGTVDSAAISGGTISGAALSTVTLAAPAITGGAAIDGAVTGSAVQSGPTDATAGRLLRVGAFGLGGLLPLVGNIGVTDNSLVPGFYSFDTALGSSGGPTNVTRGRLLHTRRDATGGETQELLVETATGANQPAGTTFARARTTGAWGAWTTGSVVGTGSNTNGRYTRHVDGSQRCWHSVTSLTTGEVTWTFPIAFSTATNLSVLATPVSTATGVLCARIAAKTTTTATLSVFDGTGARVAVSVDVIALGRFA